MRYLKIMFHEISGVLFLAVAMLLDLCSRFKAKFKELFFSKNKALVKNLIQAVKSDHEAIEFKDAYYENELRNKPLTTPVINALLELCKNYKL